MAGLCTVYAGRHENDDRRTRFCNRTRRILDSAAECHEEYSMRPILFGALTALIAAAALADPQTANVAPVTTLHAEARVVQIDAVVTDSQGKPVTDLSKQDFTIFDNGKPRGIDI